MSAEIESDARTFAQIIDDLVAILTGLGDVALNTPVALADAHARQMVLAVREGGLRAEGNA
jgi:hypothetical protein